MPSITIKDIPEELYQQLKNRASNNKRSMNGEMLWLLEQALLDEPRKRITLESIRATRISLKQELNDSAIKELKAQGRE